MKTRERTFSEHHSGDDEKMSGRLSSRLEIFGRREKLQRPKTVSIHADVEMLFEVIGTVVL